MRFEKGNKFGLGKKYRLGKKLSEETKRKISESLKGHVSWNKGIPCSEEVKQKISEALSGENNPSFGKPCSDETKLKISKTRSGRGLGYKIGNTVWLGKKHSEESKLKMGIRQLCEKNHNWKNGRRKIGKYITILRPEHPFADLKGYVLEHRLVMEQFLSRYLLPEEVVHHINKITIDNKIENLRLFANKGEHTRYHNLSEKVV